MDPYSHLGMAEEFVDQVFGEARANNQVDKWADKERVS